MLFLNNQTRCAIEQTKAVYNDFIDQIKKGFIDALIWHDESLDQYSDLPLSYDANSKVDQVVNTFIFACSTDDQAMSEIIDHGFEKTGHDLAFQMLGHGVGFWEQEETRSLNNALDHLLDFKVIKPFVLYTSETTLNCDGDQVLDWDIC